MTDGTTVRSSAEELVERADIALRRSRHSRQSTRVAYRPGMNEDLIRRLTAERTVHDALAAIDCGCTTSRSSLLVDGHVSRVEALVGFTRQTASSWGLRNSWKLPSTAGDCKPWIVEYGRSQRAIGRRSRKPHTRICGSA